MKLRINAKNFQLTPDLENYIETKLQPILKLIDPIGIHININQNQHHRKGNIYNLEAAIHIPGKIIKASAKNMQDIRKGFDTTKERLKKQIIKFKARINPKKQRGRIQKKVRDLFKKHQ